MKVIQKCFFLERIILTWFFLKILTYVCALPLVLQTNCVLNKNVTRCCRRTWRLPSRIFKTCNIPFSFTYNIVYYSVHIPTYKSWTTSHNLVMGRVSTWKFGFFLSDNRSITQELKLRNNRAIIQYNSQILENKFLELFIISKFALLLEILNLTRPFPALFS